MTSPVLVIFRHGNTFEIGETPVWVGARTDMLLTREGEAQAKEAARYVQKHFEKPDAIISGPLKRTRHFADIISTAVGKTTLVDDRLCEIDYGFWEGLSNDEIKRRFGPKILEDWERKGCWPEKMNWQPQREILMENLSKFLQEQLEKILASNKNRLLVTSNGILRIIYQLVGEDANRDTKVKTGNFCVLIPENNIWRVAEWNVKPQN